jgi:hypothetical protein
MIQGETKPIRLHLVNKTTRDLIDISTATYIEACFPGTTAPVDFYYQTISGDTTTATDLISNIADTSKIFEGMKISGPGIPASTTVLKTPASTTLPTAAGVIQISANATATAVAAPLLIHNIDLEASPNVNVIVVNPTEALSKLIKAAKDQTIEVSYVKGGILYKAQQTKILNVSKSICV